LLRLLKGLGNEKSRRNSLDVAQSPKRLPTGQR
jgi:hypothetical protein